MLMLHSSSPFFDDRVYVEISVNYGYGMNAVTQLESFPDDRVYIEISINYGYGMNANVT